MWDRIQQWLRGNQTRPTEAPASTVLAHSESAGAAYGELIEAELNDESERRQGIERRAQIVISSVGAILGLAIAIASFVGLGASFATARGSPGASPSQVVIVSPATPSPSAPASPAAERAATDVAVDPAAALLAVGGFAFLVAILTALYAMAPQDHEVAQIDALERLAQEQFWSAPRALGSRRAAEVRVRELRFARIANARKARALILALIFEVIGITSLGALALSVLATLARP